MIKLQVYRNYRNRDTQYRAGEVIEVTEERARFLMADAPGVFAYDPPTEDKTIRIAPRDKMQRRKVTK